MSLKLWQVYRFQIKPTISQKQRMVMIAGCVRFVYNKALDLQLQRMRSGAPPMHYFDVCKELVNWKTYRENDWLNNAPSQALQCALDHLNKAFSAVDVPRFKKRGQHDSFRFPQGIKLDNDKIYLPKIGWVRFHKSREVEEKVKNVTVSRKGDHWYVSIQTEREVPEPTHPSTSKVGIDLGVTRFATLSDGTFFRPVNSFRKHEQKLKREQRKLSRKVKFSNNWRKQKTKVQKVHETIANVRKDFLHKASTQISKNHAVVVMEDLKVSNMSKSAAGSVEQPGRNVKAKSGLNKAILDQGWFEFRRQLTYKQLWAGGQVILVNPAYTSQKCSVCGFKSAENRQTQSDFQCVSCGHAENADVNAAKNIKAAGLAVLACGDITSVMKQAQEPTSWKRR